MAKLSSEQIKQDFLNALSVAARRAERHGATKKEALEIFGHSVMAMFDGISATFPNPVTLVVVGDDPDFIREARESDEDWIEGDVAINESCHLNKEIKLF